MPVRPSAEHSLAPPRLTRPPRPSALGLRLDMTSTSADIERGMAGSSPEVQLVFDKVTIEVPTPKDKANPRKRILDEVSGIFGPSEATAVMGPSGSGKTTMLNALTGVSKPTSGTITINGQPFDEDTVRPISSLVPQDDLLTPILTVRESLMEAAVFKTKRSLPERIEMVDSLLRKFGLEECKDVLVGHPEGTKGISGGQKRRLSVALELCGEVSLLYLDEPTSGLDSVSAMSLVELISSLAKDGKTVIATIHQPSAAAFFKFDRLLLLVKGRICYSGPISASQPMAFLSSAGFDCPPLNNPADFLFEILGEAHALTAKFMAEGLPEDRERKPAFLPPITHKARYASSFLTQVKTHVRRNGLSVLRDPNLARLRLGSSVVMGLAMGILYFDISNDLTGVDDRVSLLLFMMLFLAVTNSIPVLLAVVPELAVARKEARNNWYAPTSFIPAKLVTETPLLIVPPIIFLAISGNMSNLSHSDDGSRFLMLAFALVLLVTCAHGWALLICALAPSMNIAFLAAPGSIMPMAVLSGFFKNQQQMSWVFRWFTYIDFLNYGWQTIAYAGFRGLVFTGAGPYLTGDDVLKNRLVLSDPTDGGYWTNIGILIAFIVVFRLIGTLLIARKLRN